VEALDRNGQPYVLSFASGVPTACTAGSNLVLSPRRDAEGRIAGWYMLLTDIDDRKRAEEELYRSKAYLTEAQRLSRPVASAAGSRQARCSGRRTFRIYGIRPIHPTSGRACSRAGSTRKTSLGSGTQWIRRTAIEKDCCVECRLLLPDGSVKHVCIVAHASKNESGTTEFIGAVMDVTAQRQG